MDVISGRVRPGAAPRLFSGDPDPGTGDLPDPAEVSDPSVPGTASRHTVVTGGVPGHVPTADASVVAVDAPGEGPVVAPGPSPSRRRLPAPAALARLAKIWGVVLAGSMVLVLYGLEPMFQQRAQSLLFDEVTAEIRTASNEASGFYGVDPPTTAIEVGRPVGILEVSRIQLQQVMVEGVTPAATADGPGHVPGTAGPGQPGNAVVLGRRTGFGAPFSGLHLMQPGDPIVVTTAQGRSVYAVVEVDTPTIGPDAPVEGFYGGTADDRLTLVTSGIANPMNSSEATVVTAALTTVPFAPTPQNGRVASQTGLSGDRSALGDVLVAMLAMAAVGAGMVLLHRRCRPRIAYLVTAAPALAATIVLAESVSRLLPAWA